jgi:hypothetical protein
MLPLTGQILNTGHLTQPTANATGQSVMMTPKQIRGGLHAAVSRMLLPTGPDGDTFHDPPGLSLRPWLPVNRYVRVSDYPDMKKYPDVSLTSYLQNMSPGKERRRQAGCRHPRDRCLLPAKSGTASHNKRMPGRGRPGSTVILGRTAGANPAGLSAYCKPWPHHRPPKY